MMKTIAIAFISLVAAFCLGYLIAEIRTENQMIVGATDVELQDGLDVYRECMQSAEKTGCRMSVENFRTYHAIKREIQRRRNVGEIVCRYESSTDE